MYKLVVTRRADGRIVVDESADTAKGARNLLDFLALVYSDETEYDVCLKCRPITYAALEVA